MRTPQAQYERDRTALKHYLLGKDYSMALGAMGIAERWHVGFRKDKVTPELHHQIGVCFNFINTPIRAASLTACLEEAAIAALLCHDVVEDYPVTYEMLRKDLKPLAITLIKGMTKVEGETKDEFFERLLGHWLLPILKACDRDNNVMTMQGAFTIVKMKAYIAETKSHILALLKKACRLYPLHTKSYTALATGIKKQLRIYEGFIATLEVNDEKHANELVEYQLKLTAAGDTQKNIIGYNDELLRINGELRKQLTDRPEPTKAEAIQCAADIMLDFVAKVPQQPGETVAAYRDRLVATIKFSTDVALGTQKSMLAQANTAAADDVK